MASLELAPTEAMLERAFRAIFSRQFISAVAGMPNGDMFLRGEVLPPTPVTGSSTGATEAGQAYAGLKTMPQGSYERVKVGDRGSNRGTTHFLCKYRDCNREFTKSTSLIVHYWRHTDTRPFTCNLCNTSFTQSGTLSRHNRAVHKIRATVSLT